MYKMIFSDLDETLLVNHHVPAINREAVNKAKNKSVRFTIATGRAYYMIQEILDELDLKKENQYSICFNGGLIMENNDHCLFFKGVNYQTFEKIYEYGKKLDICILVFTLKRCFIFHADQDEVERKITQKAPFDVIDNDDYTFLKDEQIAKVMFMKKDMTYLKAIKETMEPLFTEINFSFSSNRYIEMNAKGISKGEGIKWLANYLNIPIQETIAIGDNYNDESMIKEAGLGCCVKSSNEDIKAISDYVCQKDYMDGSVSEVIEKFILGEK